MRIIITGAASGLGSCLAVELGKRGHDLCLLDLKFTVEQKDKIWQRPLDVSQPANWQLLANEMVVQKWVPDVLINNAGVAAYGPISDIEPEMWSQQLAVNLTGPFLGMKYLQPILSDSSLILNIGSRRGLWAERNRAAYSAAKFGLRGLTLAVADELKGKTKVGIVELDSMLTDWHGDLENKRARQELGELFLDPEAVAEIIADVIEGKQAWLTDWKLQVTPEGSSVTETTDGRW